MVFPQECWDTLAVAIGSKGTLEEIHVDKRGHDIRGEPNGLGYIGSQGQIQVLRDNSLLRTAQLCDESYAALMHGPNSTEVIGYLNNN